MTANFRFRPKLTLALFCALLASGAAQAGNYVLEVGGKAVELDLDTPANVDLGGGKPVAVVLRQKAEQVWRGDGMTFTYPTEVKPSRREIAKGAVQTSSVTPSGSLVIVQYYSEITPENMIGLMIAELTDDDVKAGNKRTIKPATRKLASGATLEGKAVRVERAQEYVDFEILATSGNSGGYVIVSRIGSQAPPADGKLVSRFWQTLQLNVKP